MDFLNTNFELTKEQVNASLSCIYSKEDVLNIIESLKQKTLTAFEDNINHLQGINKDELIDIFSSAFERELGRGDYIDMHSAEFFLNHNNQIELEQVNLLNDDIADTARDVLHKVLTEDLGL